MPNKKVAELHPLLVKPGRLSLVAALEAVGELDFASLRNGLEVSDSVLSKQVSQLEAGGLVSVRKGYAGKRPRTWLSLTDEGRKAFKVHRKALLDIIGR